MIALCQVVLPSPLKETEAQNCQLMEPEFKVKHSNPTASCHNHRLVLSLFFPFFDGAQRVKLRIPDKLAKAA